MSKKVIKNYIIFSITNRVNNKKYFAICREDKLGNVVARHNLLLDNELHPNKHLQHSYNFYATYPVFKFDIAIKGLSYELAKELLDELINHYDTINGNFGYNHIGVDLING